MIRKIFFFVLLVYTTIWFSVAYTVKNKIVDIINNSETDNIKLSYSQIKVSGFPTQMKIALIEPKIKFIDRVNSREISVDQLELLIALNFKNMHLIIGNNIKQQDNFGDKSVEYNIKPKESIIGLIKFDKTLYQLSNRDTLKSVINSLEFSNGSILVTHQDKELFNLTDLAFLINKVKSPDIEDIALQLRLLYSSEENYLSFKKAKLDLSTIITIVIDKTKNTESIKNLVIDRLIFVCDDDAQVDLFGSLGFSDDKLPRGKLSF
jgi:phage antirepressor YoqD-like protein